jgi:molybdopterin converting factor small subunit
MVTMRLSPSFREYVNGVEVVEVKGNTVRECLNSLIARLPGFGKLISDSEHALSVLIIYDGEVIVPNRLDKPVADHSEISILPMIYGG